MVSAAASAASGGHDVDPMQQQVEDALRRVVRDAAGVPKAVARRAFRVPIAWARAMVGVVLDGLIGSPTVSRDPESSPPPSKPPAAKEAATAGRGGPHGDPAPFDLPIEDYQSLAASQVIARLERMSRDELARIRDFELAHRGRRTVIGKIDRLIHGER